MWRNVFKTAASRKAKLFSEFSSSTSRKVTEDHIFLDQIRSSRSLETLNTCCQSGGSSRIIFLHPQKVGFTNSNFPHSSNPVPFYGVLYHAKGYATAAEAAIFEGDLSGSEEIQEIMEGLNKQDKVELHFKQPKGMVDGNRDTKYDMLRKRQIKIETEAWEEAAKEYQDLIADICEQKLAPNLPYMKSLFLGWFQPLRDAIVAEQESVKFKRSSPSHALYFHLLPADMMAVITMHKLMGLLMSDIEGGGSVRVTQAASGIGEAIENEVRIRNFFEKTKKQPEQLAEGHDKLRKKLTKLMKQQKLQKVNFIVKNHDDSKPWGTDAHVKVGCRLIQLLIETAYIQPPVDQIGDAPPDLRPAFVHSLKTSLKESQRLGKRYGVIECDPLVYRGMVKTAGHMIIPYMPMLVPPRKWTGYDQGAHFFLPSYVMRIRGARQQREAVKRASKKQLGPVFKALDILGSTKWRVNKRVLSVIEKIWASGGRLADLVDREDMPLPEQPMVEDEAEIRNWKWKVKAVKRENSERHSQRCDTELKLAVARKMKEEEGFYYPHNLDFRGRAYPMHPHLNHIGSDFCRGTLEFAEGRPLGESGLRWLKIHLANLYAGGVDKLSYKDRISFTENHLDEIFDSADRPLEGSRWWLGAEDPFQCLAVCIDLSEALRSPSPETTISHMPVHQDGSCNGLQHYAALGRDKLGAEAVNLAAGDKPADVYSGIASRVLDIMRSDAAKDPASNPNALHARLLINQVDRKLVKQTVMTSVYGVTYAGAKDQIRQRLKERSSIENERHLFTASCYAAKTTLTAIGEMFEAAKSIMNWLGECAKVIASENQAVRWTTPLGLPVVQPYRKLGRHLVKTSLQMLSLQRETDKVMAMRQRTAFPPNYIHSLDSSHMMMTALACKRAGLNFAGVHDSYWTHACDVDEMNIILRKKFVELYEAPILENLLKDFQKSFPNLKFPPLPVGGDFDLKEVLQSTYFFN
ncbi:DNA-directed RNA polymerase 1B, mitochondrial [Cucumis sativus]|uniref:DNA-directed RNA polymerase 1B, mitochondrial n=1 Tax=Cucumis sativus TaxID=3659 RepID=UPI0012F50996|nr:DNA-directed RNA polymerase 1B, mitochondrial [Cucumis sativus]KAE8648775.1 hypothetical protein Csa_008524 [Cucumis sativus]